MYVTGNLNSRTGKFIDFLEFDKYLDNQDEYSFHNDNLFTMRSNSDHVVDYNGRKLISLCKSTGHIIANGRLHKDRNVGNYTFCSSRGLSVRDYLLLDASNVNTIHNFEILEWSSFSDHAAINFSFKTCYYNQHKHNSNDIEIKHKLVWDENKIQDFKNKLENNIDFLNTQNINDTNLSIDTLTCNLTHYLHENAMNLFW